MWEIVGFFNIILIIGHNSFRGDFTMYEKIFNKLKANTDLVTHEFYLGKNKLNLILLPPATVSILLKAGIVVKFPNSSKI